MEKAATFYLEYLHIGYYEFGFSTVDQLLIEITVIDHQLSFVRTLGFCESMDEAENLLEKAIRNGFNEKGVVFNAIPNFELIRCKELVGQY
ncbi:hypothetical protein [Cytobacillus purgationiresistens]|uniref:Uncharacterized protein n=1 Tax=Cytobacillus purgationiresistens TaxID=863449 RepID=A0ABU0AKI6_9BACI|nr:hypothetical protein [Cytobacillus purgationiresistens]MDQ0271236.1 hypothetical protein [Cytobacillus purgationiresistens]